MKQLLFSISLIVSGSIILGLSQLPIYYSLNSTSSWSTPPGFLFTALISSGTIPFLLLGIALLLIGLIYGYKKSKIN
ncbi:MAG: LPXTG cell wall anchor domain-containing protein [Zhenhengia sp.]|uniref:LPXTG cell wall anchor domain-containing protein n=1 Tax=Zhenhengia sp. TaxID=2944208 RepID=UPI00399273E8